MLQKVKGETWELYGITNRRFVVFNFLPLAIHLINVTQIIVNLRETRAVSDQQYYTLVEAVSF
jgi:hypothetical protein